MDGGLERCPVDISWSVPFSPGFLRGWHFSCCPGRRSVHPSGGTFPSIFWCFWFCGPSVFISFFAPSREEWEDWRNCLCRSPTGTDCAAPFRSRPVCCCSFSFFSRRRHTPYWERGFSEEGRCGSGSEKEEPVSEDRGLSIYGESRGDLFPFPDQAALPPIRRVPRSFSIQVDALNCSE